jgi:hypothetical protein
VGRGRGRGGCGAYGVREKSRNCSKNSEQYKCHKVIEKKEIAKQKEKLTNRGEGDVKCCTKTGLHGTNMSIMRNKKI